MLEELDQNPVEDTKDFTDILKDKISENNIPEFTLAGKDGSKQTHFKVKKLLPMEGFDLLEDLRIGFVSGNPASLAEAFVGYPKESLKKIRHTVFQHVEFKNDRVSQWTKLANQEPTAFIGLLPVHIYAVLGRALAVNFFESLEEILSLFPESEEGAASTSD